MPDQTWNNAVITALRRAGGSEVPLEQIYSLVRRTSLVTPEHLQPRKSGGQPKYQCWVRRCLTNLTKAGIVRRVDRGTYSLR